MSEDEDPVARYDRLAEAFRRETGLMAPGKDIPAACGGDDDDETRMRRWIDWLKARNE